MRGTSLKKGRTSESEDLCGGGRLLIFKSLIQSEYYFGLEISFIKCRYSSTAHLSPLEGDERSGGVCEQIRLSRKLK